MEDMLLVPLMVAFVALILWIVWQIFGALGDMAERRGKDRLVWQVPGLVINPFVAMLILWIFADTAETDETENT